MQLLATVKNITLLLASSLLLLPTGAHAKFTDDSNVQLFIKDMHQKHGFAEQELDQLFAKVQLKEEVLKAMSRPAESKPWYQYRPIFITSARAKAGAQFYQQHLADLQRAEQEFGVPAEIITAILGVETRYGKYTGRYPVLDSLATLAFHYPKRSAFFTKELEYYLLLTREEKFNSAMLTGSYAGAMGYPQFIASSYRHYAIDYSGDGKRDLIHNTTDAIGSIANYFKKHGWQTGAPIASTAVLTDKDHPQWPSHSLKPSTSIAEWRQHGLQATTQPLMDDKTLATLIKLEQPKGEELWLGYNNFYVITRYNHSPLYAMAVYQLSEAIKEQYLAMAQAS